MTPPSRDSLDAALGAVPTIPPPPPGAALEAALAAMKPVAPRRPWRDLALVAAASLIYGAGLVAVLSLRRDRSELPMMWMAGAAIAWALGFVLPLYLALIPRPGAVMPRWRLAGFAAITCAAAFMLLGLLVHPRGPSSIELGAANFLHGHACMEIGLLTALVPVALGALVLRGSLPVGARWTAAGLGAAGGSLGGLVLHLHCPVSDPLHLGFVHGGVVLLAALLSAAIVPRATD
jgi:negative regulator of sigma F NrsF-like protein